MPESTYRTLAIESYKRLFAGRVMRFAAVGGIVTVFFMGLNALFGRALGLPPGIAFLVSYPPALGLHFLLNKLWTFGDRRSTTHHQVGEYLFSVVVTFLIQWPAFTALQTLAGLPGWVAAGGANLLQMSASYALLRWKVFHASAAPTAEPSNPWHRLALLLAVLGGLALLYWTAMAGWSPPRLDAKESDYYNLLVSGFRKGTVSMDVPVPEALKNAENPWDPAKRPAGVALHDASYFGGRYYLYFGVVPAVQLFWPYRALLGSDLPIGVAALLYVAGAFLVTSWLWLRILGDCFQKAGLLTKLAGPVVLGLCGGQLVLLRRAWVWEMPIAAGHFHMVLFLAFAYATLCGRKPMASLAGAGLSLALAVGCRPTLAAAGPALAGLVIWVAYVSGPRGGSRGGWPAFLRALLYAGIPFAAAMAGLLYYNWARFGNPLEFGLNYQLTAVYEAKASHFLARFAPFNLGAYFFGAPQWGRYFPFIHPIDWLTAPRGYYGMEFVYGAALVCPVIWWMAAVPTGVRTAPRPLGSLVGLLAAVAVGTSLVLACFNTAAARYLPDFLPWWLWIGTIGWAAIERRLSPGEGGSGVPLAIWRLAFGSTLVVSVAAAFLQSVALHGVLEDRNPRAYASLARFFDRPAAAWERMTHRESGPVEMDVVFPSGKTAVLEPLIVTGVKYEADYFFVYYKNPGVIRLGYESSGDAPVYSPDIPVEQGRTYHLRFEGGSLYPPEGHPLYEGWTARQIHLAKSWVAISLDGRRVVAQQRQFHEGAPEFLQIGSDIRSGAFGRRFSGQVSNVRGTPLRPPGDPAQGSGDVVLNVTIPEEVVPGSQPLVVAGERGSAELVGLRLLDAGRFVLTYEKWGGGYWESDPVAVPPVRLAEFRIRLGCLIPDKGPFPQGLFNGLLIVWLNGQPVWWRQDYGGIGANPSVEVLANLVGSSAMRSSYMGNLIGWRREPVRNWTGGPFKSLEVDVTGAGAGVEPLVSVGVPGKADVLAIQWLPGHRARLLLDHWSHEAFEGPSFDWRPELMHHLSIIMPGFATLDGPTEAGGTGWLDVQVDGSTRWREAVPFYGARSSTLVFGRNPAGSSLAGQALECTLGDIRQVGPGGN